MQNNSTWAPSRPSPIAWPTEAWNAPLTVIAAVGAVAIFIVPIFIFLIGAVALGAVDPRDPMARPDPLLLGQALSYAPVAVYMIALLPNISKVSLRELGFRAPTRRDVTTALIGTVAMYFAVTLVSALSTTLTHRHDTEAAIDLLRKLSSPGERILFIAIAVVLAPMVEELLFRVFLFNALSRYTPLPLAAIISGLAFGLVHSQHLPDDLPTIGLPLAVGGIVLAYVYASTRCYWANVITHATFNAISVVAVMFFNAK